LPLPAQRGVWLAAGAAAITFWRRAAADSRISDGFRAMCGANERMLRGLAAQV
jgi:hypothetical protein